MKILYSFVAAITLFVPAFSAVVHDWENPAINSNGRMAAATYAIPLESGRAAFTDDIEFKSPWMKSLNGTWKFRWVGDSNRRPFYFWNAEMIFAQSV